MRYVATIVMLILMPGSAVPGSDPGVPSLGRVSAPTEARDAVCWEQMPNCDGSIVSSEIISTLGLETEVANDFLVIVDVPPVFNITRVYWFGHCQDEPCPELLHFNFFIYEDDGACAPGQVLDAHLHVGAWSIDEYCGGDTYVYEAVIASIELLTYTRYWISIQADDHELPHRWGILEAESVFDCESMFRSDYFGYPDWVPAGNVVGHEFDASFGMECYIWAPSARSTTWGAVKGLFK